MCSLIGTQFSSLSLSDGRLFSFLLLDYEHYDSYLLNEDINILLEPLLAYLLHCYRKEKKK